MTRNAACIAFIGSAGIPNRYGGFEAFLESCAPRLVELGHRVLVTCDAALYEGDAAEYRGVCRRMVRVRANGASSVLHDFLAFSSVFREATHIVVLGVSGGPWFPLFRAACAVSGKRLIVNVDGLEWRRTKFGAGKRLALRVFGELAQWAAHTVVVDNGALLPFLSAPARRKAFQIAYPGDHVLHSAGLVAPKPGTVLSICRIEPENNVAMAIEGFLASGACRFTVVGNWAHSEYGQALRARHAGNSRLRLLDPTYDAGTLCNLRELHAVYIHGHSVGGTNPSLVEMLFYDSELLCFDSSFNQETAGASARYFEDAASLTALLDMPVQPPSEGLAGVRRAQRARYSRDGIVAQYLSALGLPARGSGLTTPPASE